ncbi:MAG: RNA polymerase factor sigma-54 [Xylophilus ampelinus]
MPLVRQSPLQVQRPQFSTRLQKAVKLLQMPNMEFAAAIRSSLADNPFLECDDLAVPDAGVGARDPAEWAAGGPDRPADAAGPGAAAAPADGLPGWGVAMDGRRGARHGGAAPDALASVPAPTRLQDHLHAQLRLLPLPDRAFLLASVLCESIDDDGYLREPLDALAFPDELAPAPDAGERAAALACLQSLEPAGVGARSVCECLRLQLQTVACPDDRALCERMLHAWEATPGLRDPLLLADRIGCGKGTVQRLLLHLRGLDPRPGRRYGPDDTRYLVPDVIARRGAAGWTVDLNEAVVPRVWINQPYAALHRRSCEGGEGSALGQQLSEARWTVRNIERRFSTILEVARAIVRHQHRFLDHGTLAMRPLGLRQIAQELGMHESTVSRVTNQKYLATPNGTIELGAFFSRGMEVRDGGSCAPMAVRGLVQQIIAAETGAPLSDAAIALRLQRQGIRVARRTVTKYRQQLGLRPADRRRGLG